MIDDRRMTTRADIVAAAADYGIALDPGEIVPMGSDGWLTIDGMDARQWLDAMTMD